MMTRDVLTMSAFCRFKCRTHYRGTATYIWNWSGHTQGCPAELFIHQQGLHESETEIKLLQICQEQQKQRMGRQGLQSRQGSEQQGTNLSQLSTASRAELGWKTHPTNSPACIRSREVKKSTQESEHIIPKIAQVGPNILRLSLNMAPGVWVEAPGEAGQDN